MTQSTEIQAQPQKRAFNTSVFKSFVERYYLKDNTGNVAVESGEDEDGSFLRTRFKTNRDEVLGNVTLRPFDFEECTLGVGEGKALLGMLRILDDRVDIELSRFGNKPMALKLTDGMKTVKFHLTDMEVVPDDVPAGLRKTPKFEAEIDVTDEFTTSFTRGMSAVEMDMVAVKCESGQVELTLGWRRHSGGNTVTLRPETRGVGGDPVSDFGEIVFRGDILKEVLRSNKGDSGLFRISPQGLIHAAFTGERFESNYYVAPEQKQDF